MLFRRYGGKVLVSALLFALTIFGLGGCKPSAPPISGGVTDKTDYDAPKEIKSKDITHLKAEFYLITNWNEPYENRKYCFEVKENESGILTAYESTANISVPADSELLTELQAVIDRQELAKKNGVYRVTAGLPPEYQQCSLTVNYASGEILTFTENNNPTGKWNRELFLAFANWFEANGNNGLRSTDKTSETTEAQDE